MHAIIHSNTEWMSVASPSSPYQHWCYTFKMQFFQTHFKFQQTNEQTDLFMLENKMPTTILTHCCFHKPGLSIAVVVVVIVIVVVDCISFALFCSLLQNRRKFYLHFLIPLLCSFKIMHNSNGIFFLLRCKIYEEFLFQIILFVAVCKPLIEKANVPAWNAAGFMNKWFCCFNAKIK